MNTSIRVYVLIAGFLFLLTNSYRLNAQSVFKVQDLYFGIIIPYGQGGAITVSPDFSVSQTGDLILKGNAVPAIFDLDIKAGENYHLNYPKKVTLKGNNGGALTLVFTDSHSNRKESKVGCSSPTRINLGGTLTIGPLANNPIGKYNGCFQMSFTVNHY